jgi:Tfp pilus assembly protein PilW
MSITELMVAVLVGSLVIAVVYTITLFTAKSFAAMGNYGDLDNASRNALDVLSRDLRQSRSLIGFATNQLTLLDNSTNALVYSWDPDSRNVTRGSVTDGVTNVILSQCDYLSFDISQRNPSNNFSFYSTTTPSLAKLVDVSWRCSRTIFGNKVNTESVQTAKIVIRN